MEHETQLRQHLVKLISGSEAHADFDSAVKDFPASLQGQVPHGAEHSPWMQLEHLRLAQSDILEFSRDSSHVSPKWPGGYWPKDPAPQSESDWDRAVDAFHQDQKAMCDLIMDPTTDLFTKLPHGDGQTILREALLIADHNAYHVGQLVLLRKQLGAWKK